MARGRVRAAELSRHRSMGSRLRAPSSPDQSWSWRNGAVLAAGSEPWQQKEAKGGKVLRIASFPPKDVAKNTAEYCTWKVQKLASVIPIATSI